MYIHWHRRSSRLLGGQEDHDDSDSPFGDPKETVGNDLDIAENQDGEDDVDSHGFFFSVFGIRAKVWLLMSTLLADFLGCKVWEM